MQTIITKFLGPTNHKGARVKARQSASYAGRPKSLTVNWDHALGVEDNHKAAAMAFAQMMDWPGHWVAGDSGMDGLVFVNVSANYKPEFTIKQMELV